MITSFTIVSRSTLFFHGFLSFIYFWLLVENLKRSVFFGISFLSCLKIWSRYWMRLLFRVYFWSHWTTTSSGAPTWEFCPYGASMFTFMKSRKWSHSNEWNWILIIEWLNSQAQPLVDAELFLWNWCLALVTDVWFCFLLPFFFCGSLEAVSKEKKLLFISLYFLIWGEAANVRFLPECLCYIFHHVGTLAICCWCCYFFFLLPIELSSDPSWIASHLFSSGGPFIGEPLRPPYNLLFLLNPSNSLVPVLRSCPCSIHNIDAGWNGFPCCLPFYILPLRHFSLLLLSIIDTFQFAFLFINIKYTITQESFLASLG